jgi:hypothetical protein
VSDPVYPCYVDFDQFIDVERLRSLDGLLTERIRCHARDGADSFFLNEHRLEEESAYRPGVREIWLTELRPGTPYDYLDLDNPGLWQPTRAAIEFAPLMEFLATLPFAATGRILIIYDQEGNSVPAHRDHVETGVCNEFVWMRTNFAKPFYLLDPTSSKKLYVSSHSAWFDTVNQYHGADACHGLSFSIRVDGVFSNEFRRQIPHRSHRRSATPAVWANLLSEHSS